MSSYTGVMELVRPSIRYKNSFLAAVPEMRSYTLNSSIDFDFAGNDFDAFVRTLNERTEGKGLPEGYVPDSIFWLVEGDEFIGDVRIRHRLNEHLLNVGGHIGYYICEAKRGKGYGKKILELALSEAKRLGLDKVLLTCDETNIASRKIIEKNGGILEDKRPNPDGGPDKLRFWIDLT